MKQGLIEIKNKHQSFGLDECHLLLIDLCRAKLYPVVFIRASGQAKLPVVCLQIASGHVLIAVSANSACLRIPVHCVVLALRLLLLLPTAHFLLRLSLGLRLLSL